MTPTKNDTTSPRVYRVYRGGSWYYNEPPWVRAASRITDEPAYPVPDVGFRTSLPVRQPR